MIPTCVLCLSTNRENHLRALEAPLPLVDTYRLLLTNEFTNESIDSVIMTSSFNSLLICTQLFTFQIIKSNLHLCIACEERINIVLDVQSTCIRSARVLFSRLGVRDPSRGEKTLIASSREEELNFDDYEAVSDAPAGTFLQFSCKSDVLRSFFQENLPNS